MFVGYSPAKINLLLKVLGRREDGYHNLVTLYQLLSWGDKITLFPSTAATEIILSGPYADQVPQKDNLVDNLVWRAWELMKQELGRPQGNLRIELHKNIPAGSGLGGGSSNAATLMKMLRLLWSPDMPLKILAEMGASLGADVPVFIYGQTSLAQGKGDIIQPLFLPRHYYLVFAPEIHSPTQLLFDNLAQDREQNTQSDYDAMEASIIKEIHKGLDTRLKDTDLNDYWLNMEEPNDFSKYVVRQYPELKPIRAELDSLTPNKLGNQIFVSGTGSSMFAVYDDKAQAHADQRNIFQNYATAYSLCINSDKRAGGKSKGKSNGKSKDNANSVAVILTDGVNCGSTNQIQQ